MYNISPIFKQFLAIMCCNLLTISQGITSGYATINFNELQSENSTFPTGPLSLSEASLFVSITNVGSFIGNFAILPIEHVLGVKRTIHILCVPLMLSTILLIWARSAYYLFVARLLSGFVSGAMLCIFPILIHDISFDRVRGALNSLYHPSYNIGIIISFIMGNYLSCLDQAKGQLILPMVFFVLMFILPESPEYWLKRKEEKLAQKSFAFYKGSDDLLENMRLLPKPISHENVPNEKLTLRDFLTPHARRAFFISFTMLFLSMMSGSLTILSYVTNIFSKTGSSLSPKNSSLLVVCIQVSANFVVLNVVERINRRTLYIWSSISTATSLFLFSAYCLFWYKQPGYEWMPPFCFACIIFSSCLGLLPVPYLISTEIFPKKIRKTCLALAVSMAWIFIFALGTLFPILLKSLGLFYCMVSMGVICILNAIFGVFIVPETRGKSYDEIMQMLNSL